MHWKSNEAWPQHGGRPDAMLMQFGLDPDREVLDFSANINPLGPPGWLTEQLLSGIGALSHYPDPEYAEAHRAIARQVEVTEAQVRLTNGGVEAVFLAAALHARKGRGALVIEPTFAEYARACRHYGLGIMQLPLGAEDFHLDLEAALTAMHDASVIFVCRPNNPTGTVISQEIIETLLERGRETQTTLVVDEAFMDFVSPDQSLIPLLSRFDNLIVLRSLTKLFAIPGLRLGYLLASTENVARIAALQMPWSVNALAAGLVEPLLADRDFVARTQAWLSDERPRLERGLDSLGFQVVPSHTNFLLFRHADETRGVMGDVLEKLLHQGILVRHTRNFAGLDGKWLRVAVRSPDENDRLLDALARIGAAS
nr:threonine-phosphate decarboxylase CobD [Halomonas xinjiangensis]